MRMVLFIAELLIRVLGVAVLLFVPFFLIWLVVVFRFGKGDPFFAPFLAHIRSVVNLAGRSLETVIFTADARPTAIRLAANIAESPQIRSHSRIHAVTSLYLMQFWRQNHYAAVLRRAYEARWRNTHWWMPRSFDLLADAFLGRAEGHSDALLCFSVSYGFSHGKNFATERPLFLLTPRSVEDEEKMENILHELESTTCAAPSVDLKDINRLLANFAELNEYQTMVFRPDPDWEMYAVTDTEDDTNLAAQLLEYFTFPENYAPEDFYLWIRNAEKTFVAESGIYSCERQGRIGRRVGYAFFILYSLVQQLSRRPIVAKPRRYSSIMNRLVVAYREFHRVLPDYLHKGGEEARARLMFGVGTVMYEVHCACGSFRSMSRFSRFGRHLSLFRHKSVKALSESIFWDDLRRRYKIDEMPDARGCPVFDAVTVDTANVKNRGDTHLWDLTALLSADNETLGRFLAAACLRQPPADYDSLVLLGTSGIVPGVLLAAAFRKRFSVAFLQPSFDLFPLPSHLEKLALVDDSFQTAFTTCGAVESLKNLGFLVDPKDVLAVLKYDGFPECTPTDTWPTEYKDLRHCVRSIVNYDYVPSDNKRTPFLARATSDLSGGIPSEMAEEAIERAFSCVREGTEWPRMSLGRIVRMCMAEGYCKPWRLFSFPWALSWLAAHRYEDLKQRDVQFVVASGPLDLPLLVHMALVHRLRDPERKIRFVFYDRERNEFAGLAMGGTLQGQRAAVLDCTIKSGATLDTIKKRLAKINADVVVCYALFSVLPLQEIEKLGLTAVVAKFIKPATPLPACGRGRRAFGARSLGGSS